MSDLATTRIDVNEIYGEHIPSSIDDWYADLATDVWNTQKRMWKIAHKLAFGEDIWGDQIYQYLEQLPWSPGYLANLKMIGTHFPPSRRRELEAKGLPELPISYYQELCPLLPDEQERVMWAIVKDNLKRGDIRELKRLMGQQVPANAYELACINDILVAENSTLKNRNGRNEAELVQLRDELAQATAEAEHWRVVAETERVVCPECGAVFGVAMA